MIGIYYIGYTFELNKPEVKELLIKYGYEKQLKERLNISYSNLYSYCTLDIETSGLFETDSEIIEIAIARVRNSKIIDTYTSIIKPQKELTTNVQTITNMSNAVLEYAEDISTVLPQAMKFIGNDIIICHNAKFIMEFLKCNCEKLGIKIDNEVIDTITIGNSLFPDLKNKKLSTLCEKIGLPNIQTKGLMQEIYTLVYIYEYYKNNERKQ